MAIPTSQDKQHVLLATWMKRHVAYQMKCNVDIEVSSVLSSLICAHLFACKLDR